MEKIKTDKPEVSEEILDRWQSIVDIIASISDVAAALIIKSEPSFMQIFVSSQGENNPYKPENKEKMNSLYSEHVIRTGRSLNIANALKDENWKDNPDIELDMISYYGLPVYWPDGQIFGTICILDRKEQKYSQDIIKLIDRFKDSIEFHLKVLVQQDDINNIKGNLRERAKELSCLFRVTELLLNKEMKFEDILQKIGVLLPDYFRFPERTKTVIKYKSKCYPDKQLLLDYDLYVEDIPTDIEENVQIIIGFDKNIDDREEKILADEKTLIKSVANLMANIIDKKEKEQQLVLTKNKLFTTLYSIGDGVIVTDIDGRVTFMNLAAEEMTDWKFEEAENLDINIVFNIVDSHTGEPAYNPLNQVLEKGQIVGRSSDTTLISKDGFIRQIIDTAAPILDIMNNITGAILVFSDITSEYKYKQELENSKRLLQSALDSLSENIAVINKNGYITHVNKFWEDFARENGIDPEIVGVGVNYFSTVLSDDSVGNDAKNFIFDIKDIMSGAKKEATMEYTCHSPDEERWFIARATPLILGENDIITGAVISHDNITARKKSEINLINEQRWLSTIFKNSNDAMVKVDSDHRVIDINKKFTELFEYRLADVKGLDLDDVLDKRELKLKAANRKLTKKFLAGEHVELEEVRYTKSSDEKVCLIRGIPVIISGEMVGGYGQYIDITERKRRVEKIKHMSYHDSLTGLYNRYYLEEELKRLERSKRYPVSIIMFDLNGLKLINDSYGHHIGDLFLIEMARILKKEFNEKATIGRWGGDEFLVILPGVKKTKDEIVANKITEEEMVIEVANKDNPFISIAHGISVKEDLDQDIFDKLHLAEDNMFKDKLLKEQSTKNKFVKLLLSALHEKSVETETHALRMGELAKELGKSIGLPNSELDKLSLLASLHDIGKIMIPDEILNKPEELNSEEWELMEKHPVIGYRICSSIDDFSHIANEVLSHHERWDGRGYPRGIQGKKIPIGARVLSIVDAFDVMTNGRPYKDPMSHEEALKEIELGAGSQFDPELAKRFIEIMR